MSDQNTTITATALARMLQQFQGSVNLRALASSYLDQAQALEDAAWPLLDERGIDNATGDRLDRIGAIVKTMRGGRNDTDYRLALNARIGVLTSQGTEADLLTVVQLLLQMFTPDYEFTEYFPKGVVIRAVDFETTDALSRTIGTALKQAVSAGTSMHYVAAEFPDSLQFQLSSLPSTSQTSAPTGLGNDAQTSGGRLSESY
jgi:hypothetical protein